MPEGGNTGSKTACLVCGTDFGERGDDLKCLSSEGREVIYLRCGTCGSMQLDPLPSKADVGTFYKRDYYGCGGSKFIGGIEGLRNLFIKMRARAVMSAAGGGNLKVLDVGCGSGTFLFFMSALGAQTYGTELDGPAYERARTLPGAEIVVGDLADGVFARTEFDVITVWHVLEHTREPAKVLAACAQRLKSGGMLFVEVPRIESWQGQLFGSRWLHLDPPRHLFQFTDAGMQRMLKEAGLKVVSLRCAAFEMGAMGALQGVLNTLIRPRDLFYNMLSTRNRCPGSIGAKVMSVLLALILAPFCALYALLEMWSGNGVVLRYVCRKV